MHAIGKTSVCFQLAGNEHEENVYIFPHLSGVIVSWRAAKALKILPPHYPLLPPQAHKTLLQATEWCAPVVVAPKKNSNKIRMCTDLSHLHCFVVRERYQSPTPAQAVADIAASDAKYFTVIDALKEYHQCPLDQHSQLLTTFIAPFGRFKYLRTPYGISSISEHYSRRMTGAFKGLSGFRCVVDDFVICDGNITDHIAHVK